MDELHIRIRATEADDGRVRVTVETLDAAGKVEATRLLAVDRGPVDPPDEPEPPVDPEEPEQPEGPEEPEHPEEPTDPEQPEEPGPQEPPATDPLAVTLYAGRMNRIRDRDVIEVLTGAVDQGDGTATLDLNGVAEAATITGKTAAGRDVTVHFVPQEQADGWGAGRYYFLPLRPDNRFDVQPGENHRKVYATLGSHGYDAVKIGLEAGVDAATITKYWLAKNPVWGGSEDKALIGPLAFELWNHIQKEHAKASRPNSDWLLLERGYSYDPSYANRFIMPGAMGEGPKTPIFIGAWGEGYKPVVGGLNIYQRRSDNVVVQDLFLASAQTLGADGKTGSANIALDHCILQDSNGGEINLQWCEGATIRCCASMDQHRHTAKNTGPTWHASPNRIGGMYAAKCFGLLIDSNFFDMNGWAEGYDYGMDITKPQPPSYYSHNIYLSANNRDVMARNNISMRAASFGMQMRPGGYCFDNVFIDNNAMVNTSGGSGEGQPNHSGNYFLMVGNIMTHAGRKKVAGWQGALSYGVEDASKRGARVGNIIAHLDDPDAGTPAGQVDAHEALFANPNLFFDDTIIWNWGGPNAKKSAARDANVEGRDPARMNATTIQRYAGRLADKDRGTIADFAAYVRANLEDVAEIAADVRAYFREGFGLPVPSDAPGRNIFRPDERGEGFLWLNPLNWSLGRIPREGDAVDINGNRVVFGAQDVRVASLRLGGGSLEVNSGRLTVGRYEDGTDGISVTYCGTLA